MIAIQLPPCREREPQPDRHRSGRTGSGAEGGVTLADVVEKGGSHQISATRRGGNRHLGRGIAVTLVGGCLGEEGSGFVRPLQPLPHTRPFLVVERARRGDVYEARSEMEPTTWQRCLPSGVSPK